MGLDQGELACLQQRACEDGRRLKGAKEKQSKTNAVYGVLLVLLCRHQRNFLRRI